MSPDNSYVDVFPIEHTVFNLPADWFSTIVPRMTQPAFLLMVLLLVVSIGLMALKRFENAHFEKKVWGIPVIITAVVFWPSLILGIKGVVDTFNTFLVVDVFKIPWYGFGFPDISSLGSMMGYSGEAVIRAFPNFAYFLIYAFFSVSFVLYAVIGPFILAKGILTDEIEAFIELLKEFTLLMLWQTTLVILVAILLPQVVSGQPLPQKPDMNIWLLSLILGILIFFIPSLTRKFGNHLGSSFIPSGFRFGGAALGLSLFSKMGGAVFAAGRFEVAESEMVGSLFHSISKAEEFNARYKHKTHEQDLDKEAHELRHRLHEHKAEEAHAKKELTHQKDHPVMTAEGIKRAPSKLLELSKRVKQEQSKKD